MAVIRLIMMRAGVITPARVTASRPCPGYGETDRKGKNRMETIALANARVIQKRMIAAGFDVDLLDVREGHPFPAGCLAFTCPARSRVAFGVIIAGVVADPMGLARDAHTHHDRYTHEVTLCFPSWTVVDR